MTTFAFSLRPDEPRRARIVRCCEEALADGPMGHQIRGPWYASFINAGMSPAGRIGGQDVASIASWRTSCALFVRAVLAWCGRETRIAVNASGIFAYLQTPGYGDQAWHPYTAGDRPEPGDVFYVASSPTAADGHVGIFLREESPGVWRTAEGGGGEGTRCALGRRVLGAPARFDSHRRLLGWFAAAEWIPASPHDGTSERAAEDEANRRAAVVGAIDIAVRGDGGGGGEAA